MDKDDSLEFDAAHIWHPYSAIGIGHSMSQVRSADGVRLTLADGTELVDGMSSWWCAIHGYNVPALNEAIRSQLGDMAHVMFGGLTHQPAIELARRLVDITPDGLETVFFADSGSVSVEVAMKMAIQYWHSRGAPAKNRFATIRNGYHGDTFGAMSVCDPVTGMHSLFTENLTRQLFVDRPSCRFGEPCSDEDIREMKTLLEERGDEIAAVILEPVVQGAGGMWFYSAGFLTRLRQLCDEFEVLLIADEIATGFGRTGQLFACEHAGIGPDIMCVGKALTGGYMTLAATLTTREISGRISDGEPGIFMHGPTFMANPLACSVANASIDLLMASDWGQNITRIERRLTLGLESCRDLPNVSDVRVLGAIGVVEMSTPVDTDRLQQRFIDRGIWVRPFGRLVYIMPPYIIMDDDLDRLTGAVSEVVRTL